MAKGTLPRPASPTAQFIPITKGQFAGVETCVCLEQNGIDVAVITIYGRLPNETLWFQEWQDPDQATDGAMAREFLQTNDRWDQSWQDIYTGAVPYVDPTDGQGYGGYMGISRRFAHLLEALTVNGAINEYWDWLTNEGVSYIQHAYNMAFPSGVPPVIVPPAGHIASAFGLFIAFGAFVALAEDASGNIIVSTKPRPS